MSHLTLGALKDVLAVEDDLPTDDLATAGQ
jgi:hypothetical protein